MATPIAPSQMELSLFEMEKQIDKAINSINQRLTNEPKGQSAYFISVKLSDSVQEEVRKRFEKAGWITRMGGISGTVLILKPDSTLK